LPAGLEMISPHFATLGKPEGAAFLSKAAFVR